MKTFLYARVLILVSSLLSINQAIMCAEEAQGPLSIKIQNAPEPVYFAMPVPEKDRDRINTSFDSFKTPKSFGNSKKGRITLEEETGHRILTLHKGSPLCAHEYHDSACPVTTGSVQLPSLKKPLFVVHCYLHKNFYLLKKMPIDHKDLNA